MRRIRGLLFSLNKKNNSRAKYSRSFSIVCASACFRSIESRWLRTVVPRHLRTRSKATIYVYPVSCVYDRSINRSNADPTCRYINIIVIEQIVVGKIRFSFSPCYRPIDLNTFILPSESLAKKISYLLASSS